MGYGVVVTGEAELVRRFGAVAVALSGPQKRVILFAGAKVVEADAKRNVVRKTGTLSRSIMTEEDGDSVSVGSNAPYARRIELGFSGTDSLGRTYDQAPRPYLRPAFDNNLVKVAQVIGFTAKQIIEAAWAA